MLGESACQQYWRPPLRRPSEETVSGIARDLLKEARHVRADLVANTLAIYRTLLRWTFTDGHSEGLGMQLSGLYNMRSSSGHVSALLIVERAAVTSLRCGAEEVFGRLRSTGLDRAKSVVQFRGSREVLACIYMQESLRLYMHMHFPAKPSDECVAEVLKACSVIAFCVPLGSEESGVTDVLAGTEGDDDASGT